MKAVHEYACYVPLPWNHRMAWVGRDCKAQQLQPLCCGQGHLLIDQVAQSSFCVLMMAGLDIWDCDCYCLAGKEDCLLGRLLAGDCVHVLAPD